MKFRCSFFIFFDDALSFSTMNYVPVFVDILICVHMFLLVAVFVALYLVDDLNHINSHHVDKVFKLRMVYRSEITGVLYSQQSLIIN